jgi:hypothetical protein
MNMGRVVALLLGLVLTVSTGAFANDAPATPKKNDPNAPPPPKPSSLTGNAMPRCQAGTYPASNICKPAPPGFYAPPDARYPVACPAGKSSDYGARGTSECY